MSLILMYITNRTDVAKIAENAGVDRIFVDMEYIGKAQRQLGMDTVQSHHTIEDIRAIRRVICNSELLVRINPINNNSEKEINDAINAGADVLMLPYFKTVEEVNKYINYVDGRVKLILLLETPEAVEKLNDILTLGGIDEIHIGINDLSLGYGKKFMFEVLADGTLDRICVKLKGKMPYGFGGIASLGRGLLPSEYVIKEHYRLGSTRAILSRSFCYVNKTTDIGMIKEIFNSEIQKIRAFEKECALTSMRSLEENRIKTIELIRRIVG